MFQVFELAMPSVLSAVTLSGEVSERQVKSRAVLRQEQPRAHRGCSCPHVSLYEFLWQVQLWLEEVAPGCLRPEDEPHEVRRPGFCCCICIPLD